MADLLHIETTIQFDLVSPRLCNILKSNILLIKIYEILRKIMNQNTLKKFYFDIPYDGTSGISYIPEDRVNKYLDCIKNGTDTNEYSIQYRRGIAMKIKFSKLLNNLRTLKFIELSDKEILDMNDAYLTFFPNKGIDFKIVENDDIVFFYNYNNYIKNPLSDGNNLHSSCMAHLNCQRFIKFYTKIEGCKLIVAFDKNLDINKICGRALLWENNSYGIPIMDRIYSTNKNVEDAFKNFAYTNKYLYKKYQNNTSSGIFIDPNSGDVDERFTIQLKNELCEDLINGNIRVPYLDTMSVYYYNRKILTNKCFRDDNSFYEFRRTDGLIDGINEDENEDEDEEEDQCWCEYYDIHINVEESVYSRYVESNMRESDCVYILEMDDYVPCEKVVPTGKGENEFGIIDDYVYSRLKDYWIPVDGVVWSEMFLTFIPRTEFYNIKYLLNEIYNIDEDVYIPSKFLPIIPIDILFPKGINIINVKDMFIKNKGVIMRREYSKAIPLFVPLHYAFSNDVYCDIVACIVNNLEIPIKIILDNKIECQFEYVKYSSLFKNRHNTCDFKSIYDNIKIYRLITSENNTNKIRDELEALATDELYRFISKTEMPEEYLKFIIENTRGE